MQKNDTETIVQMILNARKANTKIPAVTAQYPDLSVEQAYEIQKKLTIELEKQFGPVAGYKIGYADSASLKKYNIDVPAYGPLFKNRVLENNDMVPLKDFHAFSIENEITFKLGKDIDKEFSTPDEMVPYIESVHLGFDMSGVIFESPTKLQDFVADGAGSKYFMVGPGISPSEVDVSDIMLTISYKDSVVYQGSSKNALGNPWNVMVAVSNDLFKRGMPLKKDYLIFSGKTANAFKLPVDKVTGMFKGSGEPFAPVVCTPK